MLLVSGEVFLDLVIDVLVLKFTLLHLGSILAFF